jgi:Na+/H+-dicarboxylate symporter
MNDQLATLKTALTGILGTAAGVGGAMYSMLPHLEAWTRLASAGIGLLAGLLALIKIWRDLQNK